MSHLYGSGGGRSVGIGPRTSGAGRLDSLTGLRFFAAAVVFLHHSFDLTAGTLREALLVLFGHGRAGVSFFFLLSGFVLAWSMRPGDRPLAFYRRRFSRIWPAYAVAAVAGVAVSLWFDHRIVSVGRLLANLTMTQSWVPAKDWYFSTNLVGWSLSCEALFYLTFPLYASRVLRLRAGQAAALAGLLLSGILALGLVLRSDIGLAGGYALPDGPAIWLVYVFPGVRMMEFVLGIALVALFRSGSLPRIPVALAWSSLGAGWVLSATVPASLAVVAVTVVPFCLLILAYAGRDVDAPGTTLWSSRTLVWLGEISFCFYLVHQLVIRVFVSEAGRPWLAASTGVRSLKVLALIAVVSLVAAWLLHVAVEKPCDRFLRGGREALSATEPVAPPRTSAGPPAHATAFSPRVVRDLPPLPPLPAVSHRPVPRPRSVERRLPPLHAATVERPAVFLEVPSRS